MRQEQYRVLGAMSAAVTAIAFMMCGIYFGKFISISMC
jgi:hypothetical protein